MGIESAQHFLDLFSRDQDGILFRDARCFAMLIVDIAKGDIRGIRLE